MCVYCENNWPFVLRFTYLFVYFFFIRIENELNQCLRGEYKVTEGSSILNENRLNLEGTAIF